ncbi:three-helix bundle dimerization domain-containing protein [Streptomyces sp. NPDC048018]|uniref:three-helix bundle dimerization domain-containing protein n=1 Tax=Streptomyces sp. NPDC048018 TaxID=3365499 RepID=UPI0037183FEF
MTAEDRAPPVGPDRPGEGVGRPAGTPAGAPAAATPSPATGTTARAVTSGARVATAEGGGPGPAEPSGPAPSGPPDESSSLRNLVTRLTTAYPSVDAAAVEAAVVASYGHFEQARVRAYLPILVERRSRKALDAVRRADGGRTADVRAPGPEPDAAADRRQGDDGTVGFRGRTAPEFGG